MNTIENMKSSIKTSVLLLLLIFPVILLAQFRELNVVQVSQEEDNWCWAATSRMVLDYYGKGYSQTELATWVFITPLNSPIPLYNTIGFQGVNQVLDHFAGYEIGNMEFTSGILSIADIITEINNDRPIPILGQTEFESTVEYHIMVITGYNNNSATNPEIIWIDPDPIVGWQQLGLTYLQQNVSYPWEWQQTLRLQKSGIKGVGIFDGVAITKTNWIYTEPAQARAFDGRFVRALGSMALATNWVWTMSFTHAGGEYVVGTHNGPSQPSLNTTWNAPAFTLPANYIWNYTSEGAIVGKLKLSCVDTDGFYHEDIEYLEYFPPNPYPMSIVYANSSVSGPHPEVKAHQTIVLQNYQINTGANITFKAGEEIEIRDNVTIQNNCLANFIVDYSIR